MWTLLIVLVSLYLFMRISARWLLPWLLQTYFKRLQKKMGGTAGFDSGEEKKRGRKVNIKRPPTVAKTKIDTSDIEEVDYEEIK